MNFEAYLIEKKIDSRAFQEVEPVLWDSWRSEFEQMHPNSFTVQKLNLINPIRRKYPLKELPKNAGELPSATAPPQAPKPGKPVMKPKPKMN